MRIEPFAAWMLTYALHSTLLLGLAWALTRRLVQSHGTRDLIWKTALVGGLISSTVQVMAGITPVAGRFSLERAPATSPTFPIASVDHDHAATAAQPRENPVERPAPAPAAQLGGETGRQPFFARLKPTTLLLGFWAAAAVLLALHFLARQFLLVVRVGRRALVRDEQLLEVVDILREEAGIRRHIRLTRAEGLPSPVALGLSEICIPDAALTELDREQQESMLAHELAHLARRDPAWLVAGCLVERIFFFQPLNRLARRRIQEAAEYLCDDWAVRRSGSGLTLAKCLVKVAEWIDTTPEPVPVSGMAEMRSHFVSRIHRLISNRALSAPPARRWLAPAALAAVAIIVAAAPGVTATRAGSVEQTVGRSDGRTVSHEPSLPTQPVVSAIEQDTRTSTETSTSTETLTVRPT